MSAAAVDLKPTSQPVGDQCSLNGQATVGSAWLQTTAAGWIWGPPLVTRAAR